MNISFGKRIPISTTQIYNKNTKEFEKATLYELDGHDESDMEELIDLSGNWRYRYEMSANLYGKIKDLASPEKLSDFMKAILEYRKFYILKTEDDKLAAICETQGFKNFADVHYLERDKTKGYGLCGQAILASIVKHMLKQPDAYLKVDDPVKKARGFYINDCGFREKTPGSHEVEMNEAEMKTFVDNFEQKVDAPIVDIENR